MLAHDRRRVLHFNVTAHPTAAWTAQQMVEAFPFDSAPKYLLRDRDRIYGDEFRRQVELFGIKEVLSVPRSPWQRAFICPCTRIHRIRGRYNRSAELSLSPKLAVCNTDTNGELRSCVCISRRIRSGLVIRCDRQTSFS